MKKSRATRHLRAIVWIGGLGLLLISCGGDGARAPAASSATVATGDAFKTGELLGRPTDRSVALAMMTAQEISVQAQWGSSSGTYSFESALTTVPANETFRIVMDGLQADTQYFYRVRYRRQGETSLAARPERHFHTKRAAGRTYTFTIQADSHLDENSDLDLYRRALGNIATDDPDFHIDLGDTFMCEKHSAPLTATRQTAPDAATVDARYLYERVNFDLVAHSAPLFLVNGNHEGEAGWFLNGTAQNLAVWATLARRQFFLNPVPDGFYGGDSVEEPFVGRRAAWYAWEWGDALFVALDPYWHTTTKGAKDIWVWTLGERQYRWLAATLAVSRARFKFVFCHNLVGGLDGQQRGGVEAAPYFEWGGRDTNGQWLFDQKRPGWGKTIHQLLVDNGVTVLFHGHDHLYAKQDLDGIVYQEVPQPSTRNTGNVASMAKEYHYDSGTIRSSSGHLRVTVSPERVQAQYVRAVLSQDENTQLRNGQIDDTWTKDAR